MPEAELTEQLRVWGVERPDEVIFNPKNGYYSFEVVAESYQKGKEDLKTERKEKFKQTYFEKLELFSDKLNLILVHLNSELGVKPDKVYLNYSIRNTSALISIPKGEQDKDEFIDTMYPYVSRIESDMLKENQMIVDVSFLDDTDSINENTIKQEGFDFGFDLTNLKSIEF